MERWDRKKPLTKEAAVRRIGNTGIGRFLGVCHKIDGTEASVLETGTLALSDSNPALTHKPVSARREGRCRRTGIRNGSSRA